MPNRLHSKTVAWAVAFLLSLLMTNPPARAQEKQLDDLAGLKKRVQQLEETVKKLQEQLDQARAAPESSQNTRTAGKESRLSTEPVGTVRAETKQEEGGKKSDDELAAELAAELGGETAPSQQQPQISAQTLGARQRLFQGMNPNISVIGTLLGNATDQPQKERNYDIGLEESEFSFQAAVDPYARADFFVAFGKGGESGPLPVAEPAGGSEGGTTLEPEIEEAYVTLLSLPFSTQLKAGKFRAKFGKLNEIHPHAYNFVDQPLMYRNFLGGDGLVDEGVSLRWLLPNHTFYQELTLQALSGPAESPSFARATGNRLLYLAHIRNFFDLNENTTLDLGVSGLTGPYDPQGNLTRVFGTDVTIKWKPLRFNRYKSIEWTTEGLLSQRDEPRGTVNSLGFFTNLRYQVAKRWFAGAMVEYSEFPEYENYHHAAYSGILQFFATEFQKFEIQPRYNRGNFFDSYFDVSLRAVFVIGAHGAHQY